MQIDLILDPHMDPARRAELGRLAEQNGIAGVWTSSLLGGYDPFLAFAPLAATSSHIRMGPIAVSPFEAHPTRIAASLLTLNELSGGRAQVVIGGGGEAVAALNLKTDRRVTAVRECVELIRQAASGRRADFDGRVFQARGYGSEWVTRPAPRIWIGANREQMLAMAAKAADGIMVSDLPPPSLKKAITAAREARFTANNATPLAFSNFTAWHVYADRGRARTEARDWLAWRGISRREVCTGVISDAEFELLQAHLPALYRMASGGPRPADVPLAVLDALVDHLTLTGEVDDLDPIVAHLERMRDAGLTHVALRLYQDVEQSIALIGRHLVPHFA